MSDSETAASEIKAVPAFSFNASAAKKKVSEENDRHLSQRDHKLHHDDKRHDSFRSEKAHRHDRYRQYERDRRRTEDHRSRSDLPDSKSRLVVSTKVPTAESAKPSVAQNKQKGKSTAGMSVSGISDESLFMVDVRPDIDNLTYGKPSNYAVPKFYRIGRRRVLGLGPAYRLSSGYEFQSWDKDDDYKPVAQSWAMTGRPKRIKVVNENNNDELEFISISRKEKVSDSENPFRRFGEESAESDVTSSDDEEDIHSESAKKIAELSRAVDTYPHVIDNWHALATALAAAAPYGSIARVRDEIAFSVYEKAVKANPGDVSLTLKYMDLYENLKGKYFAGKKWHDILLEYPKVVNFWATWLLFIMRDAATFDYEQLLQDMSDVIKRMSAIAEKDESTQESLVYCIFLAMKFVYEAGYSEHAIAVVQGLITLNYKYPEGSSVPARYEWLKALWESDGLRIGDAEEAETDHENLEEWLDLELEKSSHILPLHITSVDATADPFRVVIFSDIEPFMFSFGKSARSKMLWTALKFLGCHVPYACDYLEKYPLTFEIKEATDGRDELEFVVDAEFVSRIISGLVADVEDEAVLEWMLRWTYQTQDIKSARKFAKTVLKYNQHSEILWVVYGELEWTLDIVQAEKVFSAAMNIGGMTVRSRWVECAFFSLKDDVLSIICGIAEGRKLSPTSVAISKAREFLAGTSIHGAKILSILEYITKSITEALQILTKFDASDGNSKEQMVVFGARLLEFHSKNTFAFKVATMREYLKEAIRLFPANETLLTIFVRCERRFQIDNVVNSVLLDDAVMANATPQVWRVAVWFYEGIGNKGMARNILEKAVNGKGKMNLSVWRGRAALEDDDATRSVIYRAVAACPWAKSILLEAIKNSNVERRAILEILLERGLRVCAEIPESLLAIPLESEDEPVSESEPELRDDPV
ncbi:NRDE-2, necessary for RNA interference-domain-containing protein [Lipomyces arxii]|uniref:NRDE-2, necessary for RNA interference-domain-containing protein n=1 Tax=Lipomyces arxii TaxID=56418 RepID=UPI0034CFADBB